MYEIGELIHYGNVGVCRITDIKEGDFLSEGKKSTFYLLQPLHQNYKITTSVDNPKIYMRRIISREEAEKLIDLIPSIEAEGFHCGNLRELSDHYAALINSHDCKDLVEMTMSIYDKKKEMEKQKRKFGAVDEKFMRQAEDLLFGELGAALGIEKDSVPDYIEQRASVKRAQFAGVEKTDAENEDFPDVKTAATE